MLILKRFYLKEMLFVALFTALIGEVYFYPFGTAFRFTAGVIAISFLMLYFKEIPEIVLIPFSGVVVFLFRVFLWSAIGRYDFSKAVSLHYPAFFYYLAYGVFLRLGNIKKLPGSPVNFIAVMALSDISANFVELFVRRELNFEYFQEIFTPVVAVGLFRSMVTFSLYLMMERYKLLIIKEEHEKRYAELLELISELKTELIFLKKSTKDLEDAMKQSYDIYSKLQGPLDEKEAGELRKKALNLAREIHEIKKDYLRISRGFSQLLPEEDKKGMKLSAILSLLKTNTERWMKEQKKQVEFKFRLEKDFIIANYFAFFSILSNLIYNALEALDKEGGRIEVRVRRYFDRMVISVEDNGCGIHSKDLPFIFEPGFSTKVLEDGSVSTGLGLTHVKNLVEEMGGKVYVTSKVGEGSRFDLEIPLDGRFVKIAGQEE
ncbi:sensor histidine kinase [Fervidicola ferrireducens]|uniref:sensor histidine kinase n=1 Tax=Fervidicola ferrireducens TaxID=520764 RepID=UPI001FDF70FB|nr:sensor histidine kinase [Fervidicola ferrireducens]